MKEEMKEEMKAKLKGLTQFRWKATERGTVNGSTVERLACPHLKQHVSKAVYCLSRMTLWVWLREGRGHSSTVIYSGTGWTYSEFLQLHKIVSIR